MANYPTRETQRAELEKNRISHQIVPEVYSPEGSMTTPFSTAFEMSNAASATAHVMKTDASAKCKPNRLI